MKQKFAQNKNGILGIGIITAIATALAAHGDSLPAVLLPYKEWIELIAVLGGVVGGVLVKTPGTDEKKGR